MELFTVIVLCYRNWEFLNEAIASVLEQDYPKIELIVSDDSSAGFPKEEIAEYIDSYKSENIKNIVIRSEKVNIGTVRHLNHNIELSNGKYICFLAADDALASKYVLSQYAQAFSRYPDDARLVMAQTAMYNRNLDELESYYLTPYIQSLLEPSVKYEELYKALCYSPCLPTTSTCYTRAFFNKYGLFDDSYKLIEDYPLHLRIAREHIPLNFINFLAVKHRDGGISHGGTTALSQTRILYYNDYIRCCQSRYSSLETLSPSDQQKIKRHTSKEISYYDHLLLSQNHSIKAFIKNFLAHPNYMFSSLISTFDLFFGKLSVKAILSCIFMMCLVPAFSEYLYGTFGIEKSATIVPAYHLLLILLILSAIALMIHILLHIYKRVSDFPIDSIYLLSR